MKKLIITILFLLVFSSQAWAAPDCGTNPELCNCVATIYKRPVQEDLVIIKPWDKVAQLGQRQYRHAGNRRFKWLATCVYYASFGIQQGPTVFDPLISAGSELLLTYLPPTTGEAHPMFAVNWWFKAQAASNDQGQTVTFMGALDASEDVGATVETTTGRTAHKHVSGSGEFLLGGASQMNVDAAELLCLRQTENEIWDELLANGCP